MAQGINRPFVKNLVASATRTSTLTTAALDFGVADSYTVVIDVGAGTGTSPTLDVVIQTSYDGGTTYINLPLRTAQITTAATTTMLVFRNGLGENEVALNQITAATGGTLAKNCNFDPKYMRIVATIGGTNPSYPTFSVWLFSMPKGTRN